MSTWLPCAPSKTDLPSSERGLPSSAVSQMYPRIFSPGAAFFFNFMGESMSAPYAPLCGRFFSSNTRAAFSRKQMPGSIRSQTAQARGPFLSSYAGPIPRDVVPILLAPRALSRAVELADDGKIKWADAEWIRPFTVDAAFGVLLNWRTRAAGIDYDASADDCLLFVSGRMPRG